MKNYLKVFLLILMTTGCGFKIVDQSKLSNFEISSIETSGDKKINFVIKNKLLISSKVGEKKLIKIKLNSSKSKSIKEKNIKNEITKYQITIKSEIKFNLIGDLNIYSFSKFATGDYSVQSKMSETLSNEKKLVELLIDSLSEDLKKELVIKLDAI